MTRRASEHDGTHPRPTLMREDWESLDGPWGFAHDDGDRGRAERWYAPDGADAFDRTITVPFVPESEASGIHETGYHSVVWYRRTVTITPRKGHRTLLHLGAVDHEAHVWRSEERRVGKDRRTGTCRWCRTTETRNTPANAGTSRS